MIIKFIFPPESSGIIWFVEFENIKLGVSPDCGWLIDFKDDIKPIVNPKNMIFLLPLLEIGRQKIYDHLAELAKVRKDVDVVGTFPESMLLKCAFEHSVSDYWPIEGLKWLELSPYQLTGSLKDTLTELQKRSWATQPLKQKIKFVLKRHQVSA